MKSVHKIMFKNKPCNTCLIKSICKEHCQTYINYYGRYELNITLIVLFIGFVYIPISVYQIITKCSQPLGSILLIVNVVSAFVLLKILINYVSNDRQIHSKKSRIEKEHPFGGYI